MVFHRTIKLEGEPLVGVNKSNSNTKSKTPLKGKPWGFLAPKRFVFSKISLTPPTSS